GAGTALIVGALWSSREHPRRVWRMAWQPPEGVEEREESRLYRRSLITLGVGTVVIPWFMVTAGLAWWMALVFYGMALLMGLIVARIRCELGSPVHVLWINGANMLLLTGGVQNLGVNHVTQLGLFDSFTRFSQNHI